MDYEDEALWNYLHGKNAPEKIQVGYDGSEEEGDEEEKKRRERRSEILKKARKPWFCPECEGVMNKRLDDRMWYRHGKCFDCVVKEETKMRVDGSWEIYQKDKMVRNAISQLEEIKDQLEEALKYVDENPTFVNEFGDIEEWKGIDSTELRENIEGDLKKVMDSLEELKSEIDDGDGLPG